MDKIDDILGESYWGYYCKKWVYKKDFAKALLEEEYIDENEFKQIWDNIDVYIKHTYFRYIPIRDGGNYAYEDKQQRRGSFPVTVYEK